MNRSLIVVAGGQGTRMGHQLPKQFIKIGDLPILMHTIINFQKFDNNFHTIVGLPEGQIHYWKELCDEHNFKIDHQIVAGGKTRFETVHNCLNKVKGEGVTAIHDGVRPFVSSKTLTNCFQAAIKNGAVVPVISLKESLRKLNGEKSVAVNRENYKLVQTPQVFMNEIIRKSYGLPYHEHFTDDASIVEHAGFTIKLVEGNIENIKITTREDLILAEEYIKRF